MASIVQESDKVATIRTEKHTLTFTGFFENLHNKITLSMNKDFTIKPISSYGLEIDYTYGNNTIYNYKSNPNIDLSQIKKTNFYCNPPIAFNEFINITSYAESNWHHFAMILYKPK